MPPTPGSEWAVAHFQIDAMHSNDSHTRVLNPDQQYQAFAFTLTGDLKDDSFLDLAWVVVWRGKDDQAPSVPQRLSVEILGGQATLAWQPSTDNLRVRNYELVRKDGDEWKPVTAATVPRVTMDSENLPNGTYAVRAYDVAGNISEPSDAVIVNR